MRVKPMIGSTLAVLALMAGAASAAAAASRGDANAPEDLGPLRASTEAFHSIAVAEQHGYTLLQDEKGIACIEMPGMGGMGVHWASSSLVNDPAIVARRPEALVYAPMPDGTLQLAALEYVVIKSAWDAAHHHPPALFGHGFNVTPTPNRYGLPTFYSLHVWVWEHNPAGTFQMWNPRVVCPGR
jgi:hypothetical protein